VARFRRSSGFGAGPGIVAALLAITSCGDGDPGSAATPTSVSTTSTTVTTTTTTVEEAVLAAYLRFWDGYLEAADPMNPEHPVLDDVATGEELQQLRSAFLARLSAGEVIRGDLELAPVPTAVDETTATVTDCYLDRTGVYDAVSGERKDRESGVRHRVTARLALEGSAWKVASITREGEGCTPEAGY
jgi:hypothetical protein